jgi:hypothetical protein
MTATEVREQLGAPTGTVRREPEEDVETWIYEQEGDATLVVRLRDERVVEWEHRARPND